MAKQTFTSGQVLTAAQMTSLQSNDYNQTVSAKTANYVLVATDAGTTITMSSATATTVTVNTSLFTAGDTLRIQNLNGGGTCTVTAGTATVTSAGSLVIPSWGGGTLYFTSASAAVWFPNSGGTGLTYLTGATFTTATSFSLPASTFTSAYRNYKLIVNISAVTADSDFTLRLRAAGTDNSAGVYNTMLTGILSNGTASNSAADSGTSFAVGESDNSLVGYSLSLDIIAPQLALQTTMSGAIATVNKAATASLGRSGSFWMNNSGQYDSLSFISSVASSITGIYRVYGYSES
jgi:hypothetical protein